MTTYSSGQHMDVLARLAQGQGFQDDLFRQLALDRAELSGTNLVRVELERCGMTSADLSKTLLEDCRFSNTSFRQANADRSVWLESRVRLCDLAGLSLKDGNISGCRFDETLLSGVEWDGSTITSTNFDLCDFTGASFQNALFMRCKFRDARLGTPNLMSCRLDGAQLVDVDLRNANLQYASLKGAVLVRVHLQGAVLDGADLEGATFIEVRGLPDEIVENQAARQLSSRNGDNAPTARAVDRRLDQSLEPLPPAALAHISRELLRTYVIEAAGALLSEDRIAALMRQRNLGFADLMRFLKEHFPHEELNQVLVEGDAVYLRTQAGDIPLGGPSNRGNPTAAGRGAPGVHVTSSTMRPAGQGGGSSRPPSPAFGRPSTSSSRPSSGGSGPSSNGGGSAPARSTPSPPSTSRPEERPASPANRSDDQREPTEEDNAFEPDRFGMIDL